MNLAAGDKVADEALDAIKKLESSRDVWEAIREVLTEIKRDLLEALSVEEHESVETSRAAAKGALLALARLITDKANEADKLALADPTLYGHLRRYDTVTGARVQPP